ncbi:MAG: FAD-binding oxidoreductase [Pseudomonadota bacterium]
MLHGLRQAFINKLVQPLSKALVPYHTFDFWMQQLNINHRLSSISARLVERSWLDDDTVRLVFQPNTHFKRYLAGQHVRFSAAVESRVLERSYSISNIPSKQNTLVFFIKVQGKFSRFLAKQLKVGHVIEMSEPFGENHRATYDIFIAGGIGITAIWPLFYQQATAALHHKESVPRLLYMSNPERGYPVKPFFDRALEQYILCLNGRSLLSDHHTFNQYLKGALRVISCGSNSFNQQVKIITTQLSQDSGKPIKLTLENFAPVIEQKPSHIAQEFAITLTKQQKTLRVSNQKNLLDSLLEQGIKPQYGCKQGVCHQCSCRLKEGQVSPQRAAIIQPCISFPQSDLELEL